jgi:hypothetical protein
LSARSERTPSKRIAPGSTMTTSKLSIDTRCGRSLRAEQYRDLSWGQNLRRN